jgi:CubicO group peptidase (beta-lactamase class C family)
MIARVAGMHSLPRSTPEEQGVRSAALHGFVDGLVESGQELHSLMVVRHGHVIAEGWWSPYRPELPHQLYSVSKSFTSMAVGLVVAEGKLSVEDQVIGFFPEHLPADVSDNLAAMKVKHLLTMTTGHAEEAPVWPSESWLSGFFAVPVEKEPGTHFVYNTPATYVLSAIVQRLTGETVLDYLRPRLFGPMGMTEATWASSPEGVTLGGFGLSLTTESVARFGRFLLDQGRYDGEQLVPAEWIEAATGKQVPNDSQDNVDWQQGYGYQFWRSRHGYRADGAFSQYCLVLPEQDTLVATTAATTDMQKVLDIVWTTLLPALRGDVPLPPDDPASARLRERLASHELQPPEGSGTLPAELAGRTYAVEPHNGVGITRIAFGPMGATVGVTVDGSTAELVCGPDWHEQEIGLRWARNNLQLPLAVSSGVWDGDLFRITVRFTTTPYCHTFECRFDGDRVEVDFTSNVAIGAMPLSFQQSGHAV